MAHIHTEAEVRVRVVPVAVQSKLLLLLAVLSTVILSTNPTWLLAVGSLFLLFSIIRRLPFGRTLVLAAIPAITALWLALAGMGAGNSPVLLATRAAVAAISTYSIISLASYSEWLQLLHKVVPSLMLDAVYLSVKGIERGTNRIIDKFSALRLRGIVISPFSSAGLGLLANCLGGILIEAWDDAEEAGNMLALRGYRPGLFAEPLHWRFGIYDFVVWLLAAGFLMGGSLYGAY